MVDLNPLHYIDKINEAIGHSTADVLEFIGITNPAVDPDGIREVARHWKALGDSLDDAHWHVGQALGELRWEGKAAEAFHRRTQEVRDHCQKAAGVLHQGHYQLNQFADQAHELISQIGVLCAQILEFELAALPLSLLTGPLSEVASNLAAGERAAKILALIARIAEAAKTVDRVIESIVEALGGLGRALKALAPIAKMAVGGVAMTVGYDAVADPDRLRHADTLQQDVETGALLGIIGGGFGKGVQGLLRGLGPRMVPALAGAGLLGDLGGEEGALSRFGALMREGDGAPAGETPVPALDGAEMPAPGPGEKLLDHPDEGRLTRDNNGLITKVDGRPVNDYLDDIVRRRGDAYREAKEAGTFSRKQTGACVGAAMDLRTGEVMEGINGRPAETVSPSDLHPTLADRYRAIEQEPPHPDEPLGHAEVKAVNRLLWDRRELGLPDDETALSEMRVSVRFPFLKDTESGAPGRPAPFCANCDHMLQGVPSSAGRFTGYPPSDDNFLPE